MADDSGAIPPPYSFENPADYHPYTRLSAVDGAHSTALSAGTQRITIHERAVGEDDGLLSTSATQYFQEHPASGQRLRDPLIMYALPVNPQSTAANISAIPLSWRYASADITDADMLTFVNYLFPQPPPSRILFRDEARQKEDGEHETWSRRKDRFAKVVAEWNRGFFHPRGLEIRLAVTDHEDSTYYPFHHRRGHEYTAYYQPTQKNIPSELHGMKTATRVPTPPHPKCLKSSPRLCLPSLLCRLAALALTHHHTTHPPQPPIYSSAGGEAAHQPTFHTHHPCHNHRKPHCNRKSNYNHNYNTQTTPPLQHITNQPIPPTPTPTPTRCALKSERRALRHERKAEGCRARAERRKEMR